MCLIYQNYHKHDSYTNVRISDSAVSIEDYAKRAVELGHGILSSVNHGWQGDAYQTIKLARKYNLKPVIGAEAYWVKDRTEQDRTNCHIVLIAKNENGRKALNDVLSEANISGFYGQPRLDIPLILSLPADDIIVTTACIAYHRYEDVDDITMQFYNHFKDNFYLEVQAHCVESQIKLNQHLLDLHNQYGIKLIAGCDSHYIYPEDAQVRTDFLISKGMSYPDEENWDLDYPDGVTLYKRFAKQCVLSHDEILEAMNNTNVFLEVEDYDEKLFNTEIKMPTLFPALSQEEKDNKYKELVYGAWEEYKKSIPQDKWQQYEEEINKEVQTVIDTKMSDYFILNHYIIKKGKDNGGCLTKSGRGSCVSFFTNMLLGFTEVDRISAKVHMYPERFMSTTRILSSGTLPDIDFNVAPVEPFARAQQQVLGEDHAYPMIAYGTMQKSAAWKLYAKSQGVPFEIANIISDQIKKYENALKHAEEDEKDEIDVLDYIDKEYHSLYEQSKKYLGLVTSWSIAPCSYLLYSESIRKDFGLVKVKDHLCCTMDGHYAEECHFLKNDLLKVSVVDLIYKAYHRAGLEPPNVQELLAMCPPNDKCWDIYAKSCTIGINQCEQTGTSQRVAKYQPKNISELGAFVAAIRPGFKSMYKKFESREPFAFGVKAFDDLIKTEEMPDSFVLYQEQEMAALNYAGIDMSDCYTAIKNIAKKRVEKVLAYKEKFITGFTNVMVNDEHKTPEEADQLSNQLWQIIEDSSRYSFNCVSGSTKIRRLGLKKNTFQPTIQEMWLIKNNKDYAIKTRHLDLHKKYNSNGYGNAYSFFNDKRIHKNKIVDIYFTGIKKVYKVLTESGKWIECTMEHKFPTPDGNKALSELNIGDLLYCSGEYETNREKYPFTDGNFKSNVPRKGQRGFQSIPDGNSVIFYNEKGRCKSNAYPCTECGREYGKEVRFELHHKDFDRTNNSPDNLRWLCASCHKKEHYKNNRVKVMEKGIPTYLDRIISIEYKRDEQVFDIEMESPAHTFVSESGLVACNCSHSYCVALDSLYGAWLKAHHPLEFYEVYLQIQEQKGDKDKMNAAKTEAEDYFNIHFPSLKFGQDNRTITADPLTNSINNSLSSIKGFGTDVGNALYDCSLNHCSKFVDVLKWLDERSIKSAKVLPLINIDYFVDYGNSKQLTTLLSAWDLLKQGNAKMIKRDKELPIYFKEILEKYSSTQNANGSESASYKLSDAMACMYEYEEFIKGKIEDFDIKTKMIKSQEVLGYINVITNKECDRKRLLVTDCTPINDKNGNLWSYRIGTRSLGSGKTARLTLKTDLFKKQPFKVGCVLFAEEIWKNQQGYWYLMKYHVEE